MEPGLQGSSLRSGSLQHVPLSALSLSTSLHVWPGTPQHKPLSGPLHHCKSSKCLAHHGKHLLQRRPVPAMVLTPPACIPSCATLNPQTALSKVTSDSQAKYLQAASPTITVRLFCSRPTGQTMLPVPRLQSPVRTLSLMMSVSKPSQTTPPKHPALSSSTLLALPSPPPPCRRMLPGGPFAPLRPEGGLRPRGWAPENIRVR